MSDLQTDIEYLEQQYLDAGQPMSYEIRNVLEAARLVANPNIEAHHEIVKELIHNGDYTVEGSARAVAAALTPGDTDER